jgi:hypothetical protein
VNTKFKVGQRVTVTRIKYEDKYCECCGFYNAVAVEHGSEQVISGVTIDHGRIGDKVVYWFEGQEAGALEHCLTAI